VQRLATARRQSPAASHRASATGLNLQRAGAGQRGVGSTPLMYLLLYMAHDTVSA
jgi:hypothetical protein